MSKRSGKKPSESSELRLERLKPNTPTGKRFKSVRALAKHYSIRLSARSRKQDRYARRRATMGKCVHVWEGLSSRMMDVFGTEKQFYCSVGPHPEKPIQKVFARRCDASRWAKQNGAKSIKHWWAC